MAAKKRKSSAPGSVKCKRLVSKTGKTFRQCRVNGKLVKTPPTKRARRS
jgi:hypothetical protein